MENSTVLILCEAAYQDGREHQLADDYPDVGMHFTKGFRDTASFKAVTERPERLADIPAGLGGLELYAWVGEDEFGSGKVGLKQAHVPAGFIPLVAINKEKVTGVYVRSQLQEQTNRYRKIISLCRFKFDGLVREIKPK